MESGEAAKVSSSPLPRHSTRYFCVMENIFNVMGMWGWTKEEKGYEESSNLVQGFDMMTMCKMG